MSEDKKDNTALGVAVIVATVFTMALADAVIKYASSDFPLWQIFVVRSLAAVPMLIVIALCTDAADIRPRSPPWAIARSLLLAFMYVAIYAAIPLLSLSVIAASLYTGPIFVALLSAFVIGEPVGARGWAAVVLGFAGVLVILRPHTGAFSFYMLIPVIAGLFYALAAVITRAKCPGEKPQTLAVMLNLSILAVGLLATAAVALLPAHLGEVYPFLLGGWIVMGAREWKLIALLALLIVIIGIGLAKAYQSAPPSVIATFDYAYLLFAAFWGWVFFAERPDLQTVTGMLVIALAGLLVTGRIPAGLTRR
ncbi:MAG: DMT family transporter [Gammaproteobacteria bacterium]|nr:DMT family transporter [Gammaproteobacteria bacterium]